MIQYEELPPVNIYDLYVKGKKRKEKQYFSNRAFGSPRCIHAKLMEHKRVPFI